MELGGHVTFNIADFSEGFYGNRKGKPISEEDKGKVLEFLEELLELSDAYHRRHYETLQAVILGKPRPYRCETLEATIYLDPDASIYPCPRAYGVAGDRLTDSTPEKASPSVYP